MNDGHKKKPQKHQNKTAFKIIFDTQALEKHKKVSFKDLCKRCAEKISWKLQYNKYKKKSEPAKCNFCLKKNVLRSYIKACETCTAEYAVCPKCLDAEAEEQVQVKKNEAEKKIESLQSENNMKAFMKTLKERSRRTVRRGLQKGTVEWCNEQGTFVDSEGEPIVSLHFRKAYADSEDNSEQDHSQNDSNDDADSKETEGNKLTESAKIEESENNGLDENDNEDDWVDDEDEIQAQELSN